jgi:predicted DNA-binding transcriptional regulator AlpA
MPKTRPKSKAKAPAAPVVDLPPGCPALLDRHQVCRALSISYSALKAMLQSQEFPGPDLTIGADRGRWRTDTLDAWIRGRCKPQGNTNGGSVPAGER